MEENKYSGEEKTYSDSREQASKKVESEKGLVKVVSTNSLFDEPSDEALRRMKELVGDDLTAY